MATEGEKVEVFDGEQVAPHVNRLKADLILMVLRLLALFATLSATLVMALNKQTRTIVVATIGTVPMRVTLTAKFQHTPAFVFFVIANGNASLHNLLVLVIGLMMRSRFQFKGLVPLAIAVLDLVNVALVSSGASAAVFMGQLGRDGNSHARWNKICDKFDTFCDRGGGAMIASFVGLMLMMTICSASIVRLFRNHNNNNNNNNNNKKLVLNFSVAP